MTKIILVRLFLGLVVIGLLLNGWWLPAVLIILGLSLLYDVYEYPLIAFCIDVYFAPEPIYFWYTLLITTVVVGGILLRPLLRIKKTDFV